MMKLLLADSQDSEVSPITHVSETGGESLKTLPHGPPSTAPEAQPDATNAVDSNVPTETDSPTTETQSESQQSSVPESESQLSQEESRDDSSPGENLNESISSSSQAAETRDQTSNDVIDHDEFLANVISKAQQRACLLYTSPSPRDRQKSRMPSSA